MVGTAGIRIVPARRPPRHLLLTVVAIGCAAAVIAATALVTDGFGLAKYLRGSSGGSPGPDPNPYGEKVNSVTGALVYLGSGGTGYIHNFTGYDLCSPCPIAPPENTTYNPPVAGLWVYFNVTNAGPNVSSFGNFSVTTSGSDPGLFELNFSACCYPTYDGTDDSYIGPGLTFGFAIFLVAPSIPDNNGTGYAVVLHATSYAN
jgi:hypothetical protein